MLQQPSLRGYPPPRRCVGTSAPPVRRVSIGSDSECCSEPSSCPPPGGRADGSAAARPCRWLSPQSARPSPTSPRLRRREPGSLLVVDKALPPVSVSAAGAGVGLIVAFGTDMGGRLSIDQRLQNRSEQDAHDAAAVGGAERLGELEQGRLIQGRCGVLLVKVSGHYPDSFTRWIFCVQDRHGPDSEARSTPQGDIPISADPAYPGSSMVTGILR